MYCGVAGCGLIVNKSYGDYNRGESPIVFRCPLHGDVTDQVVAMPGLLLPRGSIREGVARRERVEAQLPPSPLERSMMAPEPELIADLCDLLDELDDDSGG